VKGMIHGKIPPNGLNAFGKVLYKTLYAQNC